MRTPGKSIWTMIVVVIFCSATWGGAVATQDHQAVQKRLLAAVEAGELSLEQAGRMMAALKEAQLDEIRRHLKASAYAAELRQSQSAESDELAAKLKAAIRRGDLSEDQAWQKWKAMALKREHRLGRRERGANGPTTWIGVPEGALKSAKQALVESGIKDDQLKQTMGVMLRVVHAKQSQIADKRIQQAGERLRNLLLEDVNLSEEQVALVEETADRLVEAARANDDDSEED